MTTLASKSLSPVGKKISTVASKTLSSKPVKFVSKSVSQRAESLASTDQRINYAGNQITRGLPKRGAFFSRTPGQPMSASVVQDASQLTVEYR